MNDTIDVIKNGQHDNRVINLGLHKQPYYYYYPFQCIVNMLTMSLLVNNGCYGGGLCDS